MQGSYLVDELGKMNGYNLAEDPKTPLFYLHCMTFFLAIDTSFCSG